MKKIYSLLLLGGLLLFGAQSAWADYYVANNGKLATGGAAWAAGDSKNKMTEVSDGVYCLAVNNQGTDAVEFKITNGTWTDAVGYANYTSEIALSDVGGNFKFQLPHATDIKIYYVPDGSDKVYVEYATKYSVTINLIGPASYLYAWSFDSAPKFEYMGGWPGSNTHTGTAGTSVDPYVYTISNVPKGFPVNIKFTNNSGKESGKFELKEINSDNQSFTFNIDDNYKSFSLKGQFNNWVDNNTTTSGEITLSLAASRTYTFGVNSSGTWYAGGEGWEDLNVTSNNCTQFELTNSSTADLVLNTTTAGDYTFKWDATNNKLSVIYPTYPVTLSAAGPGGKGYATLFLPVAVTIPSGVSAYYQSGTDPTPLGENHTIDINFTKISGSQIPAETPVLLTGTASSTPSFAYYSNTVSPVSKGSLFKGVTKKSNLSSGLEYTDGDYIYLLANSTHGVGFYLMDEEGHVNASRCYLVIPSANSPLEAPAIHMWIEDENGATALPFFTEENNVNENAVKFIEDGKLFIRKNGVVYDATGRIVR